ncbi:Tetratricopeptide repeat family protein, partial (plasmid) [Borrelia parkeri SLO]
TKVVIPLPAELWAIESYDILKSKMQEIINAYQKQDFKSYYVIQTLYEENRKIKKEFFYSLQQLYQEYVPIKIHRSVDTHQSLSKVYLKIGAYELAITHGLVAAIGILTKMYDCVSYYEPLYEFKNLRSFVQKINEYTDVKTSFESTDFWEIVYTIAYATYSYDDHKHTLRAIDTWKLIVDLAPKFSPYVLKSKIHIRNFLLNKSVY